MSTTEEQVELAQILVDDLHANILVEDELTALDLLDCLGVLGLKLGRLAPEDAGRDGVSVVTKAYVSELERTR